MRYKFQNVRSYIPEIKIVFTWMYQKFVSLLRWRKYEPTWHQHQTLIIPVMLSALLCGNIIKYLQARKEQNPTTYKASKRLQYLLMLFIVFFLGWGFGFYVFRSYSQASIYLALRLPGKLKSKNCAATKILTIVFT